MELAGVEEEVLPESVEDLAVVSLVDLAVASDLDSDLESEEESELELSELELDDELSLELLLFSTGGLGRP